MDRKTFLSKTGIRFIWEELEAVCVCVSECCKPRILLIKAQQVCMYVNSLPPLFAISGNTIFRVSLPRIMLTDLCRFTNKQVGTERL